ncbi:MAG: hypothetical protein K8Q91_00215 [Candidatus Vogelbacteria bacterium]|nr:hypothetical protein [Candidatus Vogelbacteria bacterium]
MNANNEEFNRIEELKKRLYDRDVSVGGVRRSKLSPKYQEVVPVWTDSNQAITSNNDSFTKGFLYKLALISAIFFALTLAVAGFWFFQGANLISNRNIDFSISGPATTKAGDETNFQIIITNRNKLALDQVVLTVEYPNDTKQPGDATVPLRKVELPVGSIAPGETINKSVSAALFGNENEAREVTGSIAYRVYGSNAVYQKDSKYNLIISSPPVSIAITAVPESIVDHEVSLDVKITSNAQSVLRGIALQISYPRGFEFISSTLEPTKDNNFWVLGEIKSGSEQNFTIKGRLTGVNQEVKIFQALLGVQDIIDEGAIETKFTEVFKTITLKQPFIALDTSINGSASIEPVVTSGGTIRVDLNWINSLASKVVNNQLEVSLSGEPFNKSSVSPGTGFYRVSDGTISWTQVAEPKLADITSLESGKTSFTFNSYSLFDQAMAGIVNPTIKLNAVIRGTRISEGFPTENIETKISRKIKLNSILRLSAKVLHQTGPLTNTGPIPPKVDQETTYSIDISVLNTSNDVSDSYVKVVLPQGVRFIGETTPKSEKVTYNPVTSEVRWDLGRVVAGTGVKMAPREVIFKVGLTPSLTDRQRPAVIVKNILLSGVDLFTNNTLQDTKNTLNTSLLSEPGFEVKDGLVVE